MRLPVPPLSRLIKIEHDNFYTFRPAKQSRKHVLLSQAGEPVITLNYDMPADARSERRRIILPDRDLNFAAFGIDDQK